MSVGPAPIAASHDERVWGMLCHLLALAGLVFPLGNIIGPLIVWLMKKDQYSFVDDQGKESLNFQISMTIYMSVSAILIIVAIGAILLPGLAIIDIILVIVASVQANHGMSYRYPLTIKFIT